MFSSESLENTNALLVHTMGAGVQLTIAAILVRALYLLGRNKDTPRGFLSIAGLMSVGSIFRVARLAFTWTSHTPPLWLDNVTLALLLITVLAIPVILSAHYLPIYRAEPPKRSMTVWLHGAMIANIACSIVGAIVALHVRSRGLMSLVASAGCTISVILLWMRGSLFGNLQIRQRGLLLFSGLTTAGLIGISADLLYGYWDAFRISGSIISTASVELGNMLVTLGMMFVFANLRFADVIVKRVVGLCIWATASLSLWLAVTALDRMANERTYQKAGLALLCVALTAAILVLTPMLIRRVNAWMDLWVFEVPDFNAAIHDFWQRLLELESIEGVYKEGEEMIRTALSLAAVRIIHLQDIPQKQRLEKWIGPNPRFLAVNSPLRNITSPPADALLPLFQEGAAEHWIALSRGILRPPLTATELNFVTRVAGEIQIRTATVLAEQRRLERLRRESAFREQLVDAELRALRAQINPHFLFNSLNTIADLSAIAPDKAEEMTLRLSAVFRYVLVSTDRLFALVQEEMSFARNYLDIEKARFEDRLRVQFVIEDSVLQEKVPTLLLQPLIENAIKHGISQKREGGTLRIIARRAPPGFELIISDDGAGLRETNEPGEHVGLRNVKKRLQTAYGESATLMLRPREGGGAEAIVAIHANSREGA